MDIMFKIIMGAVYFPVILQKKVTESMVLLQALWEKRLICLLFLVIKKTMKNKEVL